MEAQLNVKRNVQDLQDFVADMQAWKNELKSKEGGKGVAGVGKKGVRQAPAPRGRVGMTTSMEGGDGGEEAAAKARRRRERAEAKKAAAEAKRAASKGSAADHTYKNYQEKWDKFDLEAALASSESEEEEEGGGGKGSAAGPTPKRPGDIGGKKVPEVGGVFKSRPMARAPSELNEPELKGSKFSFGKKKREKAPAEEEEKKGEEESAEGYKERGNGYFRRGDWVNAEICYTNATILDPENEAALANRAMARLKLENWGGAAEDATLALGRMEAEGRPAAYPLRLKVLQRRATARSHVGDGEGALQDLELATRLDPGSRALVNDLLAVERGLDAAQGLDTFTSTAAGGYMPLVEFPPATVLPRKVQHDSSSLML